MANPSANFPTALHTRVDASAYASSNLGSTATTHTQLEGKQEEEIYAIQAKLGTGADTAANGEFLVGTGAGTSGWRVIADGDIPAGITRDTEAAAAYAPIANGVTNGDSHDHSGGDGGQIAHTALSSIGTNTHAQIDTHLASTANPHSATGDQVLPSQTDNNGKILTTDGTNCSWVTSSATEAGTQDIVGAMVSGNTETGIAVTYAAGKLNFDASHNHDASYSAIGHDHAAAYAAIGHDHAAVYSAIGHDHTGVYATSDHNHTGVYATAAHNHDSTYVALATYNAHSILAATTDDTPATLTVGEQTVVGRITGGNIAALSVAQLQALLFGSALTENVSVQLDPALSADGTYSGITETGVAEESLAFGDLVCFNSSSSKWWKTIANESLYAGPVKLGICVLAAAGDGSPTKVLLWGKIRADTVFPTLTIGAPVYVGTSWGLIQTTAPSAEDFVIRIIGYGNTANELFFCPDNTYMTYTV